MTQAQPTAPRNPSPQMRASKPRLPFSLVAMSIVLSAVMLATVTSPNFLQTFTSLTAVSGGVASVSDASPARELTPVGPTEGLVRPWAQGGDARPHGAAGAAETRGDAAGRAVRGDETGRPTLPRCGHMVLFSGPRHGSTWLLDSIERCRFGDGLTYGRANYYSETWNPGRARPLQHVTPAKVLEYVRMNCSVKLFPASFDAKPNGPRSLMELVREAEVPIVMLRRDIADTFMSWKIAKEKGLWNSVRPEGNETDMVHDEDDPWYRSYKAYLVKGFEKFEALLREVGVSKVDRFDYEDIRDREFIVAENAGCYIHNCNYIREDKRAVDVRLES